VGSYVLRVRPRDGETMEQLVARADQEALEAGALVVFLDFGGFTLDHHVAGPADVWGKAPTDA
jgi:hypothetical protein